jgi:hypothetical protein
MEMKDPHLMLTESILDRIDTIQDTLNDIQGDLKGFREETHSLKLRQEKCDNYWSMVGKTLSYSPLGAAVGYVISILTGKPNGS